MLFDRYIKNKRGKAAVFGLAFILVLSLFAEFIANDKPIILKYQGEYFFRLPKFIRMHGSGAIFRPKQITKTSLFAGILRQKALWLCRR